MKVDFMLIGAAKCATTSLASMLASHPQVCFSRTKEPHFFSRYTDWAERLDEYHALFAPQPGQLLGEGSPYYTLFPEYSDTPERIHAYNPDVKLIYLIRNPIDRIYSNYRFVHAFSNLRYPLEKMEKEILENPMYVNRSRYYLQVKPYIDLVGMQQVHICFMEELVQSPGTFLGKLSAFLGISADRFPDGTGTVIHKNKTETVRNLTRWGTVIARLPGIYQLPRRLKWALRSPFEVKMDRFVPMSDGLRQTLLTLLEPDILLMSNLANTNLGEFWGLNDVPKFD